MRTHPTLALALLALAAAARPALAQEDIRLVTLRSAAYQGERQLVVRTPAAYDRTWERDRKYPVVYFTDGLANLDGFAAAARFLERLGRVPPVVLVGLVHRDRAAELAEGDPTLLAFLETEVVPWVEKTYRAAPFRVLAGHGDGARFALRALAARPGMFRAHLVLSPRLADPEPLLAALSAAAARPGLAATVIATRGDEGAASAAAVRRLGEALAPAKAIAFSALELPGEDPASAVFPGQYRALSALFAPFRMPVAEGDAGPRGGLAAVEAHYEALSRRVGFEVAPPEAVADAAARQLLQEGDLEEAIRAFRRNVERYPGSPSTHDALGEAYERNGELEAALRAYAKAVDVAARGKDPSLPALEKKLARLGATVESQRLGAGGK